MQLFPSHIAYILSKANDYKLRLGCYCSKAGFLIITASTLLCCLGTHAQDNSSKSGAPEIQFVSQWPAIESKKTGKSWFGKLAKEIVVGKQNQQLVKPVSLILDDDRKYWVLDQESRAVFQEINGTGKFPRFIEKKDYNLNSLVGICNFRKDEFLFTDSYLNKIFLVNTKEKVCIVLNDSLKLDRPTGIAYSPLNNEIWVLETGMHRLVILNEKGEVKKMTGRRGSAKGEFNFPTHIWINKEGNAYVVDAMNFRIQVFNKNGEVISVFGSNGDATGYFASPKGIATDSHGHIYVADALFNAVQIFDIHGNFLYKFGSQGQGEGQFWMPSGIYIDENNKIYVADSYNSRIQIFQLVAGKIK